MSSSAPQSPEIRSAKKHDLPVCDVVFKGHEATLTWCGDPNVLRHLDQTTVLGVSLIPFSHSGEIVMVDLARGLETPAGTVGDTDADFEATARREAWEEAGVTLREIALVAVALVAVAQVAVAQVAVAQVAVAQVAWKNLDASAAFMPVYTAEVETMPPFTQCHESRGRRLVKCEDFINNPGVSTVALRRQLIADAKAALAGPVKGSLAA
ncbi:NUDIX hydrolase [Lentzea jiangxiensis]|nr:NUDIX domain-containing protein [Lentzea jiangxiensis]